MMAFALAMTVLVLLAATGADAECRACSSGCTHPNMVPESWFALLLLDYCFALCCGEHGAVARGHITGAVNTIPRCDARQFAVIVLG